MTVVITVATQELVALTVLMFLFPVLPLLWWCWYFALRNPGIVGVLLVLQAATPLPLLLFGCICWFDCITVLEVDMENNQLMSPPPPTTSLFWLTPDTQSGESIKYCGHFLWIVPERYSVVRITRWELRMQIESHAYSVCFWRIYRFNTKAIEIIWVLFNLLKCLVWQSLVINEEIW